MLLYGYAGGFPPERKGKPWSFSFYYSSYTPWAWFGVRIKWKKPFLSASYQKAQLDFCKNMKVGLSKTGQRQSGLTNLDFKFWVRWQQYYWKRPEEPLNCFHVQPKVKYGMTLLWSGVALHSVALEGFVKSTAQWMVSCTGWYFITTFLDCEKP